MTLWTLEVALLTVTVADPTPLDGLVQFSGNASQLVVLAVVIVAAGALAIDERAELAAFLSTRVAHPRDLVIPRSLLVTAASALALTVGTVIAVALTTILFGDLPLGATAVGTVYGILYLAFAIAVVAAVAGFVRSQLAAVFVSILVLLLLPVIGIVDAVAVWLPSSLLTAVLPIAAGEPATDHLRAVAVTAIAPRPLLQLRNCGRTVAMDRLGTTMVRRTTTRFPPTRSLGRAGTSVRPIAAEDQLRVATRSAAGWSHCRNRTRNGSRSTPRPASAATSRPPPGAEGGTSLCGELSSPPRAGPSVRC